MATPAQSTGRPAGNGNYGHINHQSGLDEWEEGLKLLDELGATAARHRPVQKTTH